MLPLKLNETVNFDEDKTSKKRMNALWEMMKKRFGVVKIDLAATKLSNRHKDTLKPTLLGNTSVLDC